MSVWPGTPRSDPPVTMKGNEKGQTVVHEGIWVDKACGNESQQTHRCIALILPLRGSSTAGASTPGGRCRGIGGHGRTNYKASQIV